MIVPWRTHTASGVGPPHLNVILDAIQLYSSMHIMNSSYKAIEERIQAAYEIQRDAEAAGEPRSTS